MRVKWELLYNYLTIVILPREGSVVVRSLTSRLARCFPLSSWLRWKDEMSPRGTSVAKSIHRSWSPTVLPRGPINMPSPPPALRTDRYPVGDRPLPLRRPRGELAMAEKHFKYVILGGGVAAVSSLHLGFSSCSVACVCGFHDGSWFPVRSDWIFGSGDD